MTPSRYPASPSKLFARIAVGGMSLAVVALGALAVWASIVTQNGADGLSQAGVQTSGHLRAVQALSLIDTSTDELEEKIVPVHLAKLRTAQRVLDDALLRMENGGVLEASRIAEQSQADRRATEAGDRAVPRQASRLRQRRHRGSRRGDGEHPDASCRWS